MAKNPILHPYSDKQAFERLMILLTTIIQNPGVGSTGQTSPTSGYRDTLLEVQKAMQQTAAEINISFPENYPATPTIRKDIETLRNYGILERRMYRWGYYLGTGALNFQELKIALNALQSQAKYQGDPTSKRLIENLNKRLKGLELETKGELFYPIRQFLNRAIISTDPEEMMEKGNNQNTLFHKLDIIERAILQGLPIELSRNSAPYSTGKVGFSHIYPLQILYHDIAWYLLSQEYETGHFAIGRINRFRNYCKITSQQGRNLEQQKENLQKAHQLLSNGWGLYLGNLEEQQAELAGSLKFESIKIRFYPPVTTFILEGELRHPKQKIIKGPKDTTGNHIYVDYNVKLPPRSFQEFMLWVNRHSANAQILSPRILIEQHQQAAKALLSRYENPQQ
ncbi:WYL domain-containing protein [Ancylothrix sp. C2]|uniref:helix-turn-helix transcriptional regulator n=1 Tax=Ancylothrix sp. D3o TaxID=2953691 RepID=UPI0021BBA9E2|nr:WYL domain-containing protein [Ancylothrix sp. D3o]MCT7952250.1 WYL domain-containing protein [Ancylothrix sp. D3o]